MKYFAFSLCALGAMIFSGRAEALNNTYSPSLTDSDVQYYLNNPKYATQAVYHLRDTDHNEMHAPSIIQMSGQAHKYAAVYHTPYTVSGETRYKVNLAVSDDLITWTYVGLVADNADMPKISLATGSSWVVVTYEQWQGSGYPSSQPSRVAFKLFYDFSNLMSLTAGSTYVMPGYVSNLNGTPSFYELHLAQYNGWYSVDGQYGFHYWDGTRDVNAVTTILKMFDPTGAASAYPSTATAYNNLFISNGVTGNIGDRDTLITTSNRYNIQEGNIGQPAGSFDKWRLFLYKFSESTNYPDGSGTVTALTPQTANSTPQHPTVSFGNPRINVVDRPDGSGKAIVISYFIFGEGTTADEPGSLLYYFNI